MNDQSQQQRAAEDGPEYRSVMVSSSSSPVLKPSFLPLEKVGKSPVVVENSRIYTSEVESTRPSASSYRWEQTELPNIPIDYNLVRTNMYVKDSSAQVVADRICNELKSSSIVIDSKGCEGKVRIHILHFSIRLYPGIINLTQRFGFHFLSKYRILY